MEGKQWENLLSAKEETEKTEIPFYNKSIRGRQFFKTLLILNTRTWRTGLEHDVVGGCHRWYDLSVSCYYFDTPKTSQISERSPPTDSLREQLLESILRTGWTLDGIQYPRTTYAILGWLALRSINTQTSEDLAGWLSMSWKVAYRIWWCCWL